MRKKVNNLLFAIGLIAVAVMLCTFEVSFAELWAYVTRAGYWPPYWACGSCFTS